MALLGRQLAIVVIVFYVITNFAIERSLFNCEGPITQADEAQMEKIRSARKFKQNWMLLKMSY